MKLFLLSFLLMTQAHGKPQNWKAQKTIELSHTQIAIDGDKSQALVCPHSTKAILGQLELSDITLDLSCYEDYMGGFFHKDEFLAQKDGDAGDTWETQSLLFFDPESKSLILALKYFSTYDTSIECQHNKKCADEGIKCKTSEEFKKWNPKDQNFVDVKFKGTAPKRQFMPFDHYIKNCK